jgi:hypothetical protein
MYTEDGAPYVTLKRLLLTLFVCHLSIFIANIIYYTILPINLIPFLFLVLGFKGLEYRNVPMLLLYAVIETVMFICIIGICGGVIYYTIEHSSISLISLFGAPDNITASLFTYLCILFLVILIFLHGLTMIYTYVVAYSIKRDNQSLIIVKNAPGCKSANTRKESIELLYMPKYSVKEMKLNNL